jgi:hypothetical protein
MAEGAADRLALRFILAMECNSEEVSPPAAADLLGRNAEAMGGRE